MSVIFFIPKTSHLNSGARPEGRGGAFEIPREEGRRRPEDAVRHHSGEDRGEERRCRMDAGRRGGERVQYS